MIILVQQFLEYPLWKRVHWYLSNFDSLWYLLEKLFISSKQKIKIKHFYYFRFWYFLFEYLNLRKVRNYNFHCIFMNVLCISDTQIYLFCISYGSYVNIPDWRQKSDISMHPTLHFILQMSDEGRFWMSCFHLPNMLWETVHR